MTRCLGAKALRNLAGHLAGTLADRALGEPPARRKGAASAGGYGLSNLLGTDGRRDDDLQGLGVSWQDQ